ncbi:MAG: hypothetical protein KGH61_04785 [Candidatus Micrarchaeota archaeon]|nr:hypothetical protein [Candidatus Micrarchaeota archaeon]MDE1848233.1 hypothetical protein [Candidatus Micrarchaeota archaeon]MDE1864880.1 hypothetical protein [Candidatus Micrarchaeota archaeon]
MAATAQKSIEKWKTKRWFNVHTPKLLGEAIIGEIPAADEKGILGRVIKVSLSWITKNPAQSFMTVGLKVTSANGDAAQTELHYLELVYSYTHSLVRRGSSAVYVIAKLRDRDGKAIVLKLIGISRNKINTPKKYGIRKILTEFSGAYASSKSTEEFIKSVIDGSFQMDAMKAANKIAPMGKLEVKKIEL